MMNRQVPQPVSNEAWQAWAKRLVAYFRQPQRMDPEPVLLAHKLGTVPAAPDGLLMYDPEQGCPVVAKDGQWHKVTLE